MYLPQSALRRRVYILSDRARGVDRFIFVGQLGLRGGGNGGTSSSGDAHGHQTAAEGSDSSWMTRRVLTRTDSSIIRRTLVGKRYHSLEEVVNAFNQADDAELRLGLEEVMRKVLHAFNDMHVRTLTENRGAMVREYLALSRLDGTGDEDLRLLKDFFDSLHDKLVKDALRNRYLIEAVENTLQSVDTEIFEDDRNCLLELARFLSEAINPQKTSFSREMFPVHCSALHVVHQCLRILYDIGSGSWDPNRPEGMYAKFKDWSEGVIDVAEHYPAKYLAMLVQQSLTFLQSSKRSVRNANNARRFGSLMYGTVGVCQAVRNVVVLDFDLGNAESTVSALARARENRIIRDEGWYKCVHALDTARFEAIEDPSVFEQFTDLLSTLVLEEGGSSQEQCKVLRFSVVEMLTSLAIHGKDDAVRSTSAETLLRLAYPRDAWDWSTDPDLFLEMLDNLEEVSARGREPERNKALDAIRKLASNVHNTASNKALSEWLGGKTIEEKIQSVPSFRTQTIGNKLFTQVWKCLEGELSRASTEVRSPPRKRHFLFSPLVVRHFSGRENEYTELVEAFESRTEAIVVKVVVGPGGIGKSQLAAKVFERLKSTNNYVNHFWIPSDSARGLSAAFLQIAEYLEFPTHIEIAKLVRGVHEELGKSRSLFVFDDAPDVGSINEYLPIANGHVIVTTRDSGARDWSRNMVRLYPFNKLEARDLAKRFGFDDQSHAKDLEELFDALPQYPLALTQFFSIMKNEELSSPAEWLTEMQHYDASRREAEVMKKLSAKEDSEEAGGMVFVFNSSVRRISKEPGDLGSRSLDLLAKLALLDPNGVPIEWVYKWLGSEDRQSTTIMRKSVRLLERFSQVSWDREKNHIIIHAETQLLARHLLMDIDEYVSNTKEASEEQGIKENVRNHIRVIEQSIGKYISDWRTDRLNRKLWTTFAHNLSALIEHCESCMDLNVQLTLLGYISTAYREMCMFRESLLHCERALEVCKRLHGDTDHPDVVDCMKNYSVGLSRAGRDDEALPLDKKALKMCERLYGEADHPDLVDCMKSYSVGLSRAGRDDEALPLDKKALKMCERLYGDADHTELVACTTNYAIGLSSKGREIEALRLRKRALEMCRRLHRDADNPDIVACIKSYSIGLSRVGRESEALPFRKEALEMCERIHGDADHPDLIDCIKSYSDGLSRMGRETKALLLLKRAFEMCERLYGSVDHLDLVDCIKRYSNGLSNVGRHEEALPLLKRAFEMCERLYDNVDHLDLVDCIKRYSNGLSNLGRHEEALPLLKRAFEMCERIHGETGHPDLVDLMKNFFDELSKVETHDEAVPLFKKALEMFERIHDDADRLDLLQCIQNYSFELINRERHNEAEHLDLLQWINNYSDGLFNLRRHDEVLPFLKGALEMCSRLHGEADDPDLVKCMKNYTVGLCNAGRHNEALPLLKKAFEMCSRLHGEADDPDLVDCMKNYTVGLCNLGRHNEALPLLKKAFEMCSRLHGEADDPDLVDCMKNYIVGLCNVGKDNEALPLLKKAFEMCSRLHGEADDPDLVEIIKNYTKTLLRTGNFIQAWSYWRRERAMRKRLENKRKS